MTSQLNCHPKNLLHRNLAHRLDGASSCIACTKILHKHCGAVATQPSSCTRLAALHTMLCRTADVQCIAPLMCIAVMFMVQHHTLQHRSWCSTTHCSTVHGAAPHIAAPFMVQHHTLQHRSWCSTTHCSTVHGAAPHIAAPPLCTSHTAVQFIVQHRNFAAPKKFTVIHRQSAQPKVHSYCRGSSTSMLYHRVCMPSFLPSVPCDHDWPPAFPACCC